MQPYAVESYADPHPRLAQLGAQRHQNRERADGVQIWQSSAYQSWIRVSRTRLGFQLEYFRECPCGSRRR